LKTRIRLCLILAAMMLALTLTLVFGAAADLPAKVQSTQKSPLLVPTGEYSIGRTQFDWTDESRADPENHSGHREIVVWVWYPAATRSGVDVKKWEVRRSLRGSNPQLDYSHLF
jgi:hypothetical protein